MGAIKDLYVKTYLDGLLMEDPELYRMTAEAHGAAVEAVIQAGQAWRPIGFARFDAAEQAAEKPTATTSFPYLAIARDNQVAYSDVMAFLSAVDALSSWRGAKFPTYDEQDIAYLTQWQACALRRLPAHVRTAIWYARGAEIARRREV